MLLAYLDESYTRAKYWIAAVVVPDTSAQSLIERLDAVVRDVNAVCPLLEPYAELHGYDMFHGEHAWRGVPTRLRISAYARAFTAIAECGALTIIRGVDRLRLERRYARPYHPHSIVLWHLLERLDEFAERQGQFALAIADEVDAAADYRRDLWTFQRRGTEGYRSRVLNSIIDTIHFAPSHASRLVQAADLVAYFYRRIDAGTDRDPRAVAVNEKLRATIVGCEVHRHCWTP